MKVELKKKVAKVAARKVAKPELTLKADKLEVKAGRAIKVAVAFKNVDEVELQVVPHDGFSIDLTSMRKSGPVRIRGEKDGKATLVACGFRGAKQVIRRMIHVACEGPVLRILGFGYIPKGA
jgi:hypothetical protein